MSNTQKNTKRKLFGTDGIRGKANTYPMTPEMALRIGKSAALTLKNGKKYPKILIGKDTRLSGYILETALTSGICSMGSDVLLVGPMPTPAIAHLTKSLCADAAIVISASHNPAEDNGIKFFSSKGIKLPDEVELEMEKHIFSTDICAEHISGNSIGKATRIDDAPGRYIEFAKSSVNNINLSGLKVVLDCANGAAYKVAPMIFRELGAELVVLNNTPDGLNINDNCGSTHLDVTKAAVLGHNADIGISLDGDADRVLIVDEQGKEFDGDHVMALCALSLKEKGMLTKNTIVGTVMSNFGLEKFCKKNDMVLVRTDVGDRYVIDEMLKNGYNFGGEQSGHIIFSDFNTTGDGIITALQILKILKEKKKKLSQFTDLFEKTPQILLNVKVKQKPPLGSISQVKKVMAESETKIKGKGRILVRYSGTENICRVMVESIDNALLDKISKELENTIKKNLA